VIVKTTSLIDTDITLNIQGIQSTTIDEYFIRLNNCQYLATSQLFAPDGFLDVPFDNPIQGRQAIAQYLQQEAQGMRFIPEHGILLPLALAEPPPTPTAGLHQQQKPPLCGSDFDDRINYPQTQIQIQGKVQTTWFIVNVSWLFELNSITEIMLVQIKLLAALPELLNLLDSVKT
jgi:SnoaL-like domain